MDDEDRLAKKTKENKKTGNIKEERLQLSSRKAEKQKIEMWIMEQKGGRTKNTG